MEASQHTKASRPTAINTTMNASDAKTTGKKRPLGGTLDGWLKKPKTAAEDCTSGGSNADAAGSSSDSASGAEQSSAAAPPAADSL
eukprot:738364-Prymnesium_polylepis.1